MYKKRLLGLGIPAHYNGLIYLNHAIEVYTPCMPIMLLYAEIGEAFSTSVRSVERGIRNAINATGETTKNSEFIVKYKILWEEEVHGAAI